MLVLAPAAHEWLGAPAWLQVAQLREIWWRAPQLNYDLAPGAWGRRPPEDLAERVVQTVASWLSTLPTTAWTPVGKLYTHLGSQARGGLPSPERNLSRVRQAAARRNRVLADVLVQTPLPWLGFADVRTKGQDLWLRPTPSGAIWLREALDRAQLQVQPPDEASIEMTIAPTGLPLPAVADGPPVQVVLDQRQAATDGAVAAKPSGSRSGDPAVHLTLQGHAPALCTFEIDHFGQLLCPGPPARYQITAQTLEEGVALGYSVDDVLFLLARFSGDELPGPVVAQLRDWHEGMTVLNYEPGYRLAAPSPAVLSALRRRIPFRRRTVPLASGQDAWVGYAQAHELFRYLRHTGYTLQKVPVAFSGSGDETADGARESGEEEAALATQRSLAWEPPLPLSQLLIALGTYERLRQFVPGLAVLDLVGLAAAARASLLAEDLAAVDRLVDSHTVFLKHHLKKAPRSETNRPDPDESPGPAALDAGAASSQISGLQGRLQAAIDARVTVELTYADTQGHVTRRRVRPLHVETRWGRLYLLAYCELRQDERHFRLDRIVELDGEAPGQAGEDADHTAGT
jgi:hypothetical protein